MKDDDAETSKDLVEKEEKESTSSESYEKGKRGSCRDFSEDDFMCNTPSRESVQYMIM